MGKISFWKESKKNVSLDKFCNPGNNCPQCGGELVCEEDENRTIQVCGGCPYRRFVDKDEK